MLLPIKAIIRKNPRKKDGLYPIYFQYCYSSTNRTLLDTEIAIPGGYWNPKRQFIKELPEGHPKADYLNAVAGMLCEKEDMYGLRRMDIPI